MRISLETNVAVMKALVGIAATVLVAGGVIAGAAIRRAPLPSAPPSGAPRGIPAAQMEIPSPESARFDWSSAVFVPDPGAGAAVGAASSSGALAGRFRLAGIFIVGPDAPPSGGVLRRAILDDLGTKAQLIAGEGELVVGVRVVRIGDDMVRLLDAAGRTTELRLAYLSGATSAGAPAPAATGADEEGPPLEVSKYGRKVQENRWVLDREALLDYYRDLTADPDRIARLYETFKPDYGENGEIRGYEIDPLGEEEFLGAMGLRSGDHVRMVNSLRMSSQSRAEFFVKEFVNERLGAVVLDLDREGQPVKQVYLFR